MHTEHAHSPRALLVDHDDTFPPGVVDVHAPRRTELSAQKVARDGVIQLAWTTLRWRQRTVRIVDLSTHKAVDLPGGALDRDHLRVIHANERDEVTFDARRTFLGNVNDYVSVLDTRETTTRSWKNVAGSAATFDLRTRKQVKLSHLFDERQRRAAFAAVVAIVRKRGDAQLRAAAEAVAHGNDTLGFAVSTRAGSGEPVLRIAVQVGVIRQGPSERFSSMTPTLVEVPWPA